MINIALLSLNKVSFVSIDREEDSVTKIYCHCTVLPSSSWPYRFEKMCHGDLIVLQILLFSSLRLQVYGGLVWPLSCTVCWPPPRVTSVLLSSVSSWERIIQATIWGWLPMTIINISLHFPLINRRVFCGCEFHFHGSSPYLQTSAPWCRPPTLPTPSGPARLPFDLQEKLSPAPSPPPRSHSELWRSETRETPRPVLRGPMRERWWRRPSELIRYCKGCLHY